MNPMSQAMRQALLAGAALLLAACGDRQHSGPAPAAPAKVQPGQWRITTEMAGSLGQQSLAGIEKVLGELTPEQRKAAHMENARIEGGKLLQEVCITPEMAGKTLQSVADSQIRNMPGCSTPEIHTDGNKESLVLACGDGQFRLSLQAEYASPTENTVQSSMATPGGTVDSTVVSKRIGDC